MSNRGTLEALVTELTRVLSPLRELGPGSAHQMLRELGVAASPNDVTAIQGALSGVTTSLAQLVHLQRELGAAIEAEDFGTVAAKAVAAADAIGNIISGFNQLSGAVGGLGIPDASSLAQKLPEALLDYLLARYLGRSTGVLPILELLGILERTDHNVTTIDPAVPFYTTYKFHFGRVGGWLTDPEGQLVELYDWGTPSFGPKLIGLLGRLAGELGLPALSLPGPTPTLDVFAARLQGGAAGLVLETDYNIRKGTLEFGGDDWALTVGLGADLPPETKLTAAPGSIAIDPPGATKVTGSLDVGFRYAADEPLTLLSLGGAEVSVEEIGVNLGFEANPSGSVDFLFGAALRGGLVQIGAEDADGFLAKLLGSLGIKNTFDLGLGFSLDQGLFFHGSSTLEVQLASHLNLGPVEFTSLTFVIGVDGGKLPVGITTDIKASLGPLTAIVEGIGAGAEFELRDDGQGLLGPVDVGARIIPPRGVGISLDVGVVRGGGYLFFDPDREEYGGALQLDIMNMVSAKAIGLVTTRMPSGEKGFSLLIIISAEFSPPIQLGYGFTLLGVGGLVGVSRTVNLQVLSDGVKTGSTESVLFPKDVVANAPQIIEDLRAIFPPAEGHFLVGPMAKFGWGTPTLISLSFGLVLDIPGSVSILGLLRIALPTEEFALLKIQVAFAGSIDFDKGLLRFDAALFDSYILSLTLEGELAVRFKWSSPAGFLISVGGFHPSYQPPAALEVNKGMKRLSITILDSGAARIRIEVYFALTSNSVQLGAKAELYIGFSGFYVDGYLGFDALFRFSPFYFEISIKAGLTLHVFGADVLSIKISFSLSGPTPWRAWGTGSVTILFWEIEADFDIRWGDSKDTALPDIDVLPLLLEDLQKPAHWRALPPPGTSLSVALAPLLAPDELVLHPAGKLAVEQRVAPLSFDWQRIGHQKPADIRCAWFDSAKSDAIPLSIETTRDEFARSHYENLTDSQKLSVPAFEAMDAGALFAFGNDLEAGNAVHRTIEYEIAVIDKEPPKPYFFAQLKGLHQAMLSGNAATRSVQSLANQVLRQPPRIKIPPPGEGYVVASTLDNSAHGGLQRFASEAVAQLEMKKAIANNPALQGALHVLPEFEVEAA